MEDYLIEILESDIKRTGEHKLSNVQLLMMLKSAKNRKKRDEQRHIEDMADVCNGVKRNYHHGSS
ncbi:MAG TPA: hypothetical protein VK145_02745 [Candidatus Nanoarchaeia archaeon]|nr:hypothetical protein [Candidatus Nanoarchaeia archaeon]